MIKIKCPKCKYDLYMFSYKENKIHKTSCIDCKEKFVFEYSIDLRVTQPGCLWSEEHDLDDKETCVDCGEYFPKPERDVDD